MHLSVLSPFNITHDTSPLWLPSFLSYTFPGHRLSLSFNDTVLLWGPRLPLPLNLSTGVDRGVPDRPTSFQSLTKRLTLPLGERPKSILVTLGYH